MAKNGLKRAFSKNYHLSNGKGGQMGAKVKKMGFLGGGHHRRRRRQCDQRQF